MEEKTIQMVKKSTTYKLIIPQEVEKKIRFACQKVWTTEWSGVLFIEPKGSFEDGSLTIICKDIFLMDIGNSTYTEFSMSPDVMSYMCEHPELMDYQQGLIHSHNNMSTFFSGTDIATLKEEGMDRNNFVSLIVNNAGSYTAAITRKVKSTKTIKDCYSYEFFGSGVVEECKDYVTESEVLEYFMLDVEKEGEHYESLQDMANRLEEIKKQKEAKPKVLSNSFTPQSFSRTLELGDKEFIAPNKAFEDTKTNPFNYYNPKMDNYFGNDYDIDKGKLNYNKESLDEPILYGYLTADKDIIKNMLLQLITCSLLIPNDSKIDINKWVSNMEDRFSKRFKLDSYFREYASLIVEYITWYTEDENLYSSGCDETAAQAILAHDLQEELQKLPSNKYLKIYIEELDKYII